MEDLPEGDELDKLLAELSNTELKDEDVDSVIQSEEILVSEKNKIDDQKISVKCDVVKVDDNFIEEKKEITDLSSVFSEQLRKIAEKYGNVFEEIIKDCRKDRKQAQEVIDLFMDVIMSTPNAPRVYVEKVTDAIRAKNEIALTAIKALDSLPKLISATKGNELFQNNVDISFDAANLKNILEAAKDKED